MPKETKFRKKTEQYIETGACEGYSIQLALDSGFSKVYSIELTDHYYNHCYNRFLNNQNVTMLKGDSIVELNKKEIAIDSYGAWIYENYENYVDRTTVH